MTITRDDSRRDGRRQHQEKVQASLHKQYEQKRRTQGKTGTTSVVRVSELDLLQITENKKGEEYTRITFKPDLARFGMAEIDDDTEALLMKRVYDMAGTVRDVKVFLNDERLKVKGFKQVRNASWPRSAGLIRLSTVY